MGTSRSKNRPTGTERAVSSGRHEHHCTICAHPKREEIEQAFVNWGSPARIGKDYGISRDALYRHAHVLTAAQRSEIARKAVEARIKKYGQQKRKEARS